MKILIIGCGRVGSGLALNLGRQGQMVTVIDHDATALERLGGTFTGQVVLGSAFDREALAQAGIERADGLATVTGSDEVNFVIARAAKQIFRVPRVVARLYDPRKADIYRRLGLQTINPITWGIHRIAELLSFSHLDAIVSLGSGEIDIVETELPPLLVGRTVNELTLAGEIQVAAISRGGRTFLPTLGTVFQEGDMVHLVVLAASLARLKKLLGDHR
jgi:trk system potassium uptake protein TrkA